MQCWLLRVRVGDQLKDAFYSKDRHGPMAASSLPLDVVFFLCVCDDQSCCHFGMMKGVSPRKQEHAENDGAERWKAAELGGMAFTE